MVPTRRMTDGVIMVPVDSIRVMNPRVRNQKKFRTIVENISRIGLKKPITVSPADEQDGDGPKYNLVCGQGRLEAFMVLGEKEIPAILDTVADQKRQYVMSLVENIARHVPTRFEHIKCIASLRERGYTHKEIAAKVDLSPSYVQGILNLWEKGEELLLHAVEKGRIPIHAAVEIARSDGAHAQKILMELYEGKKLRGKQFLAAKKLLDRRAALGKKGRGSGKTDKKLGSAEEILRHQKRESEKFRIFVKRSRVCRERLMFVVSALKKLFADENFRNVLRAEKFESLPAPIGKRVIGAN